MHVCFITTSYPRRAGDGYANFVHEQARSILLTCKDCKVTVVAPHTTGAAREETLDGVKVVRFRYAHRPERQRLAYQNEGLFKTLRKCWRSRLQLPVFLLAMLIASIKAARDADILHAQWLPTLLVALPVGFIYSQPVFVTARGSDANVGKGILSVIFRILASRCNCVFAVSEAISEKLSDGKRRANVMTLHNGVSMPDRSGLTSRSRSDIICVGGLIERKRIITFLDALKQVENDGLVLESVVRIIGDGPLMTRLQRQCTERGLDRIVSFDGHLSRNQISDAFASASVLVLASESEGRPNVVLEAFASEVAVVASDIEGTRELVTHGVNGLLFELNDFKSLARHLILLHNDSKLRNQLIENAGSTLTERNIDWLSHGEQLLDAYYNRRVKA